ncbi:hypothetical protein [Actinacidiphila bryophytorum]|uniref:Secreted protein n=1 Tax=Actinacidiphila bryophytorum TaxID=1436133 RepID=A0A9W4E7X1_9ACTN|nr:hypothetical protein [Actinacidiphila bryophytorum]MBM9434848.1 hypothetical protein [Actinacidiphila bryophytorum]MBN6545097.1 hypothetical protein [Actinacidiphila bryophytorum]CAG7630801.1 conserved exported hypothetical protein [Actinacidiphila bryophytorum]
MNRNINTGDRTARHRTTGRRALRISAAVAAAFTAVVALAGSAFAGTVSPGGSFTATKSPWTVTDPTTGVTLSCGSLTLAGTLASSPSTLIGTINSASATGCSGPAGITFSLSFQGLPWRIDELAYNASTGVATGTITGVIARLSGLCNATLAGTGGPTSPGTLNWSHNNGAPQILNVTGSGPLRASSVSGTCLGLINNGDTMTVGTGAFTLNPPQTIS